MVKPKKKKKISTTVTQMTTNDFWKLENTNNDLPYYNDRTYTFEIVKLGVFVLCLFLSVLTLIFGISNSVLGIVFRIVLSLGLATCGFVYMFDKHWYKRFFGTVTDIKSIGFFLVLSLAIGAGAYGLVGILFDTNLLSVGDIVTTQTLLINMFVGIFQIMAEELFTIGLFMGIMIFGLRTHNVKRKNLVVAAIVISSIIFSLLHLPGYNYNIVQCLLVVGLTRSIMTIVYFFKRNIMYSYIVHVLYNLAILLYAFYF